MVWVKIKSWLIVALGGEPLVRFKTVERELCGMGYSRREAKKIIHDYRAAAKQRKTRRNTF